MDPRDLLVFLPGGLPASLAVHNEPIQILAQCPLVVAQNALNAPRRVLQLPLLLWRIHYFWQNRFPPLFGAENITEIVPANVLLEPCVHLAIATNCIAN